MREWVGATKNLAASLGTCSVLQRRPPEPREKARTKVASRLRYDVAKDFECRPTQLINSLTFFLCSSLRELFLSVTGCGPTDLPYGVLEFRDIREAVLR